MRILFASKPHLPLVGGAQLTTHWLAAELVHRGHAVAVFSPQPPHAPRGPSADERLGYLTLRSSTPTRDLPAVLESFRPDLVVVGGYHALTLRWAAAMLTGSAHLPTVLYLHDVGATPLVSESELRIDRLAAVSAFVAEEAERERPGARVARIPPIVDSRKYHVASSRRTALFVNPVPAKGLETAIALVRARPDVPFAFARCWRIAPAELRALRSDLQPLPNVGLRDPVMSPARLYGDARVLLVPSRYPEAWGRVASEAQASRIPVVAAATGGLREAVGRGGILVDSGAGLDDWLDAFSRVWDDRAAHVRYAAHAAAHAERPDIRPETVAERFESLAGALL